MDRINGLEEVLAGMAQENPESLFNHINNSLIDIENALANLNFTARTELDGILGSIDDLRNIMENANEQDPYDMGSFFDVFVELTVNITEGLFEYLENIMDSVNNTARGLNETENALNALNTLDDIVTDLENMGRNIESQNEEIEDNGSVMGTNMLIMIIVFSVWSIIVLVFIFVRTNSNNRTYVDDD